MLQAGPCTDAGYAGARKRNPHVHAPLRLHQRTAPPAARGHPPVGHEPHHRRQRPPAHHQGRFDSRSPRTDLLHRQRRLLRPQGRADRCRGALVRRQRRTRHLLRPRRARDGQEAALDPHRRALPRLAHVGRPGLPEAHLRRRPDLPRREGSRLALRRRLRRRAGPAVRRKDRQRGGSGEKSRHSRPAFIRKPLPLRYGVCRRCHRRIAACRRAGAPHRPRKREADARIPVTRRGGLFRQLQPIL